MNGKVFDCDEMYIPLFGKFSLLEYIHGTGRQQKFSARIFVYAKKFCAFIFVVCHDPQKYFPYEKIANIKKILLL